MEVGDKIYIKAVYAIPHMLILSMVCSQSVLVFMASPFYDSIYMFYFHCIYNISICDIMFAMRPAYSL